MTMPQIIMMNHAATVNMKRSKARSDKEAAEKKYLDKVDPILSNGKRFGEMTDEEQDQYLTGW